MDCHKEFWEAVRLGSFEDLDTGLAEITHRRIYSRPKPPDKAISTIHKAKGLECGSAIVMHCDARTFPDRPDVPMPSLCRAQPGYRPGDAGGLTRQSQPASPYLESASTGRYDAEAHSRLRHGSPCPAGPSKTQDEIGSLSTGHSRRRCTEGLVGEGLPLAGTEVAGAPPSAGSAPQRPPDAPIGALRQGRAVQQSCVRAAHIVRRMPETHAHAILHAEVIATRSTP